MRTSGLVLLGLISVTLAAPVTSIIGSTSPERLIETRQHSFSSSVPHVTGANCHVSRARPLSECPLQCHDRGLCGAGAPGDSPGECWCWSGWTGSDCSLMANSSQSNTNPTMPSSSSSALFQHPKSKFCYFHATATSFFDLTTFDEPSPALSNKLVERVTLVKEKQGNATRSLVMMVQEESEISSPLGDVVNKVNSIAAESRQKVIEGAAKVSNTIGRLMSGNPFTAFQAPPPPPPPEPEDDSIDVPAPPAPEFVPAPEKVVEKEIENVVEETIVFGDAAAHVTSSCFTWHPLRNGSSTQGFSFHPPASLFARHDTTLDVIGKLYPFPPSTPTNPRLMIAANLKWMLIHSIDGSNINYRTLAQGKSRVEDGKFVGMGSFEGIPVYGQIPRFFGGYVALWVDLKFDAQPSSDPSIDLARQAVICDDIRYIMQEGPKSESDGGLSVEPEVDCEDCNEDPINNPVIHLPLIRLQE
eukprot:c5553_g1_i1.p1 GENE.c5553_g1_i1~~c5553_g1_i1.p1  ORF type:complete len:472 (-),score=125.32 c5553_g1_i1:34-1449(-)